MAGELRAEALYKLYPSGQEFVKAVDGVDLTIKQGEFVAIIGPSGCGKTTLLNLLSGIDNATQGEVYIDDSPIFSISDNERTKLRAKNLGFIFQDFNLLDVLNAQENVELPLLNTGVKAQEARKKAISALSKVGLGDRGSHRPKELSGGQQQRVAIARAIVHEPKIVFCDEPTGNLDDNTSKLVMKLLRSINQNLGTTFIMVTHDSAIANDCTRIIELKDGKIISDKKTQIVGEQMTEEE